MKRSKVKMEDKRYIRDGRAPIPKKVATSRVMSANKAKNTTPELELRKALRKLRITNYRIHPKKIIGRPDIVFSKKKSAIFINGCYWHSCPICNFPLPKTNKKFWRDKFKRNKERDIKKNLELRRLKWKVITVWEHEIKNNPEKVAKRIKKKLKMT